MGISQDEETKPGNTGSEAGMGYICPLAGGVREQLSYIKLLHRSQEVFQARVLGSFQQAARRREPKPPLSGYPS